MSPVWECGAIRLDIGSQCSLCGKIYRSDCTNTSNIAEHILLKHKDKPEGRKLKKLKEEKRLRTIQNILSLPYSNKNIGHPKFT